MESLKLPGKYSQMTGRQSADGVLKPLPFFNVTHLHTYKIHNENSSERNDNTQRWMLLQMLKVNLLL